jgi:hypothetical protein
LPGSESDVALLSFNLVSETGVPDVIEPEEHKVLKTAKKKANLDRGIRKTLLTFRNCASYI